jgi:hypothetical protein
VRSLLLGILLLSLLCSAGWAKTYSCRDSAGQVHFSDRLQGLPEDCRDNAREIETKSLGGVQYVSPQSDSFSGDEDFRIMLQEVEAERRLREQNLQQLQAKADKLLKQYNQLKEEMSRARRVWDTDARQKLKRLKLDRLKIYEEKRQILMDLDEKRLGRYGETVKDTLKGISDDEE